MLIDIHVHTCRFRGSLTRANGTRYPTPEELIAALDAAGIDRAVVQGRMNPACAYTMVPPEEVLGICAEHPDRLIPFLAIDPRMIGNAPDADFGPLLAHYKAAGCKGVGEYVPNIPFDDPLNLNLFHQVEEAGLPLTFHVGARIGGLYGCYDELGLPRLESVLRECPNLRMLGHSEPFWSEISADVTEEERYTYPARPVTPGRVVHLMRDYPNLHGDLSAGSGFNAISRDPEFGYAFLEEFQDQLLFGTDIANVPQELPIVPYFREIREKNLISREAYEKITWRNANRLLGLGLE